MSLSATLLSVFLQFIFLLQENAAAIRAVVNAHLDIRELHARINVPMALGDWAVRGHANAMAKCAVISPANVIVRMELSATTVVRPVKPSICCI